MTSEVDLLPLFVKILSECLELPESDVGLDLPLMAGASPIDSVTLVEICVRLEDLASDLRFDFDWTSDVAMSQSRSVFSSVGTLFSEFQKQSRA